MRTIEKYDLPDPDSFWNASVLMPAGAHILTLQMQRDRPRLWAMVDPAMHPVWRQFRIIPTGHSAGGVHPSRYIGTIITADGSSVRHVFEV